MRALLAALLVPALVSGAGASASAGGRLVFERSIGDQADLYSVRGDGARLARLTRTPAAETEPSWGPSGRRIAAAGGPGLVVLTAGGRLVRRVRLAGSPIQPRWSPDG